MSEIRIRKGIKRRFIFLSEESIVKAIRLEKNSAFGNFNGISL
jgi:hypothetical protein